MPSLCLPASATIPTCAQSCLPTAVYWTRCRRAVCSSTIRRRQPDSPARSRRPVTRRGIVCLDAPISGGQAGAENGVLTVMVGGTEEGFARAQPMIDCYAKTQQLIGPSGSGQLTKMCNQIAIAGVVQGLSEAINFGQRAGLDIATVIEVISKGAAQSWQMENRWGTMIEDEFDFGFAVEWMRKDLRICLDEARRNGAELPVAALVDQFYADVVGMGGERWDTSSLIARLNRS